MLQGRERAPVKVKESREVVKLPKSNRFLFLPGCLFQVVVCLWPSLVVSAHQILVFITMQKKSEEEILLRTVGFVGGLLSQF